jgi:hypothetical protein
MVPLIAFIPYVFWNLYDREKNLHFFSLSSVYSAIFHQILLIFQQCLDLNPNPNFFSDSDPAKIFGFGSTTLVICKAVLGGTGNLAFFVSRSD